MIKNYKINLIWPKSSNNVKKNLLKRYQHVIPCVSRLGVCASTKKRDRQQPICDLSIYIYKSDHCELNLNQLSRSLKT